MDLANAVVLITGASSGIGAVLAQHLADAGANVVLFARRADSLQAVVDAIGPERAIGVVGDVTKANDLARAVQAAVSRFGRLDVLVNNAGIGVVGKVSVVPPDMLTGAWRTNVLGVVLAIQAAYDELKRSERALIVNVSSVTAIRPIPGLSGYGSTKAALDLLSNTLKREAEADGIRVLLIHPGGIENEFGLNALHGDESDPWAQRLRYPSYGRTSEDAARGIVAAMEQDRDEWWFERDGQIEPSGP